jgi:hypothetical protein
MRKCTPKGSRAGSPSTATKSGADAANDANEARNGASASFVDTLGRLLARARSGQAVGSRSRDTRRVRGPLGATNGATLIACAIVVSACAPSTVAQATIAPREAAAPTFGPCVDVRADALRRLGPDADVARLSIETPFDLDGDGVPDAYVSDPSFCGTGGCTWELYLARGTCGIHVLQVFAVYPTPAKTRSHGLADLGVTIKNGCAGLARTELTLAYDGARYVAVRERDCDCPTLVDDNGATVDPPLSPDATCSAWGPATSKETP